MTENINAHRHINPLSFFTPKKVIALSLFFNTILVISLLIKEYRYRDLLAAYTNAYNKLNTSPEKATEAKSIKAENTIPVTYRTELIEAPNKQWSAEVEYLLDFTGKCHGRFNLMDVNGKRLMGEFGTKGSWRGDADIQCQENPVKELNPNDWLRSITGWSPDSTRFYFQPDFDLNQLLFAKNEDGKWLIDGFEISGTEVVANADYSAFLVRDRKTSGNQSKLEQWNLYNSDGALLTTKQFSGVYEFRIAAVENSPLFIGMIPSKTIPNIDDTDEIQLYFINPQTKAIDLKHTTQRTRAHCDALTATFNSADSLVEVQGECLEKVVISL